jgi:hypothetical protein
MATWVLSYHNALLTGQCKTTRNWSLEVDNFGYHVGLCLENYSLANEAALIALFRLQSFAASNIRLAIASVR